MVQKLSTFILKIYWYFMIDVKERTQNIYINSVLLDEFIFDHTSKPMSIKKLVDVKERTQKYPH